MKRKDNDITVIDGKEGDRHRKMSAIAFFTDRVFNNRAREAHKAGAKFIHDIAYAIEQETDIPTELPRLGFPWVITIKEKGISIHIQGR